MKYPLSRFHDDRKMMFDSISSLPPIDHMFIQVTISSRFSSSARVSFHFSSSSVVIFSAPSLSSPNNARYSWRGTPYCKTKNHPALRKEQHIGNVYIELDLLKLSFANRLWPQRLGCLLTNRHLAKRKCDQQ